MHTRDICPLQELKSFSPFEKFVTAKVNTTQKPARFHEIWKAVGKPHADKK